MDSELPRPFKPVDLEAMFSNLTDKQTLLEQWAGQEATHLPFDLILGSVPIEIVVFDPQHRYLFCNPEAVRNADIRAWIIGKDDFEYCAYRGFDPAVAHQRRERFTRAVESRASAS